MVEAEVPVADMAPEWAAPEDIPVGIPAWVAPEDTMVDVPAEEWDGCSGLHRLRLCTLTVPGGVAAAAA